MYKVAAEVVCKALLRQCNANLFSHLRCSAMYTMACQDYATQSQVSRPSSRANAILNALFVFFSLSVLVPKHDNLFKA